MTLSWLGRREFGLHNPLGSWNKFCEKMYSSYMPCYKWDNEMEGNIHGGVFSLEFSPDGSLLVAACEKRSFVVFDPLSRTKIETVENAHIECVNGVKFFDSRSFATCSDDLTVALWDARQLKQKVHSLKGHSNWVKNIEYSPEENMLISSGFDGNILAWDVNNYSEDGRNFKKLFTTNGLMRTKLAPDGSKLVMSTTGGFIIVIHNLNLGTLQADLAGFKPNLYRLMQHSQSIIPIAYNYTHLFKKPGKRNRVEFIADFPDRDDAEVISSLQIHPDGQYILSRNTTSDETGEWSCVHSISELDGSFDKEEGSFLETGQMSAGSSNMPATIIQHFNTAVNDMDDSERVSSRIWEGLVPIYDARIRRERLGLVIPRFVAPVLERPAPLLDTTPPPEPSPASSVPPRTRRCSVLTRYLTPYRRSRVGRYDRTCITRRAVYTRAARHTPRQRPPPPLACVQHRHDPQQLQNMLRILLGLKNEDRVVMKHSKKQSAVDVVTDTKVSCIHRNTPRLCYYSEEPNLGKGFIKELCFSPDGRIVCSPYGNGIRILAFSPGMEDIMYSRRDCLPTQLHEVCLTVAHKDHVVSTKFSPHHNLLVSGCLSGVIRFYQPQL